MAKMSKKPRNEVKQRLRVFENNTILLIFSFLAAAAVWFAMMASNSESRATVIRNVPINVEISDTAQEAGVRVFSMSFLCAQQKRATPSPNTRWKAFRRPRSQWCMINIKKRSSLWKQIFSTLQRKITMRLLRPHFLRSLSRFPARKAA